MSLRSILATAAFTAAAAALTLAGCATSEDLPAAAGPGETVPEGEGICLMNNCSSDDDCGGCEDDRNRCLVEESRCIACDPNTGEGCKDGYTCSSWGICAPDGQTCDTDDHGDPTFDCAVDDDCLACSPMNQVCDPSTKRCTACTTSDTQHCLQSDVCVDGKCAAKCPESCSADNDCGQCGTAGNEAHACNAHRCAQCSATFPCAAGLTCNNGTCTPQCGIAGPTSGECLADTDCGACGDSTQPGSWECKKPINQNGPGDHGTCGPKAAGCSDLGTSVAVLPSPWDDVTNTCSNDSNCNGVGITFNVGQMIRDLVGDDKIDLGFTEISIKDANVQYQMSECADIQLTESVSCGVCVPCKVDSDCEPIAVDPLIAQMFQGEILAQLAGSMLIDLLYGNNATHNLNFQCQPVAAGYGVCAPCANPLQACGTGTGPSQQGGSCGHSPCDTGAALSGSCDSCASNVCQHDSYCCSTAWDGTCVGEVAQYCGTGVCSGGGGGCAHSECSSGPALTATCSSCATSVCQADPYCCNNQWDSICVNKVSQYCGSNACSSGGGGGCAHSECTAGAKLTTSCSACSAAVCGADPYCCNNSWDSYCVQAAETESSCGC